MTSSLAQFYTEIDERLASIEARLAQDMTMVDDPSIHPLQIQKRIQQLRQTLEMLSPKIQNIAESRARWIEETANSLLSIHQHLTPLQQALHITTPSTFQRDQSDLEAVVHQCSTQCVESDIQ